MTGKPLFTTERAKIIASYAAAWLLVVAFLLLLHHVFKLPPHGQPDAVEYLEDLGFALGAGLLFWLLSDRHLHKIEAADRQLREFTERTRLLSESHARLASEILVRERTEQTLREIYEGTSAIINGAMDAIVSVDAHHRIVLFNPAAEAIFRCPAEDAIGKPLDRFIPAPYREWHHRHVLEFGRTGATRRSALNMGPGFTALRADGEPFPFEASISKTETGGEVLYTAILRDLTEQRRLQKRAREWEERLLKAGHLVMLGEMATTLAHELNQPLTAIAGYAEGCLDRLRSGAADPAELAEAMEQAAAQALRAGDIIRTVRGFAKKREMVRIPVDVNQIVREMAGFAEHQAHAHSVTLALNLAPALPAPFADRVLIELVMVNLIRNGIESMTGTVGNRRLEIGTLLSGDNKICISVRDAGLGLSSSAAENVLDPFFTTKPDGMGMGLAISRSIVESHGGTLWFEPNTGRGTTFYFSLPTPPQ